MIIKRLLRKKIIYLIMIFVFCISIVNALNFLTKMEFEITGLTGITQLDNSDGKSVNVSIINSSGGIIVTRNAAAGIYKENMTIVMTGAKFNLSYRTNHTYNLSTIYGDFLYNFTTPKRRIQFHTGQNTSYYAEDDAALDGTSKNFVDNGDETVTDEDTGLMWAKGDLGGTKLNWSNAINNCSANTTGGYTDWRLPTFLESFTLYDYSCGSSTPSHCYASFSNNVFTWSDYVYYFWTSTTNANITTQAFVGAMSVAYGVPVDKSAVWYARCVRDE